MVVLVTGSNGQLGQSLQFIAPKHPTIQFVFCKSADLDITNLQNCQEVFSTIKPDYCINTAAYTAVDKAESEPQKASAINVTGSRNLAETCKIHSTILLHVSTDFIFDGSSTAFRMTNGYTEIDIPNPTSVYGQTKLDGEKEIQKFLDRYFIIRTSWVYSQFGNNFMKTMLRLASERDTISVVNDQIGTPTNAVDLAETLIKMIKFCHSEQQDSCHSELVSESVYGIYNFSNEGKCSWYEFAKEIFEVNKIKINLQPIPSTSFPTPAKRPKFSVLDKTKIKNTFNIDIRNWQDSIPEMM